MFFQRLTRQSQSQAGFLEYALLVALLAIVSLLSVETVGIAVKKHPCMFAHRTGNVVAEGLFDPETGACYEFPGGPEFYL